MAGRSPVKPPPRRRFPPTLPPPAVSAPAAPATCSSLLPPTLAVSRSRARAAPCPRLGFCLDPRAPCLVYPRRRQPRGPPAEPPRRATAARRSSACPTRRRSRSRSDCASFSDATRALAYLHAPADGKPRTLHRDVKPSNILIGANGEGYLADVGLAKGAEETSGPAPSHMSTAAVKGTLGFLGPIFTASSGKQSEVTDAFGIGITLLMCLAGLPGLEILSKCRTMLRALAIPTVGCHPRSPTRLLVSGRWRRRPRLWSSPSDSQRKSTPMSACRSPTRSRSSTALRRPPAGRPEPTPPGVPPPAVRECQICMDAPREVRFRCGHASCCQGCLPELPRT